MIIATIPWVPLVIALTVVLTVLAVVLLYRLRLRLMLARELGKLNAAWGEEHVRERDLPTLREFHHICPPPDGAVPGRVDDQTWNDLNMDAVYSKVDRTLSTAGACLLYRILRTPLTCPETLTQRGRMIRLFQDDSTTRQALHRALLSAGRSNSRELIALVWAERSGPAERAWLYYALTTFAVASLASVVLVGGPIPTACAGLAFVANMAVHYRAKAALMGRLAGLRGLGAMIHAAQRIAGIGRPELATQTQTLRRAENNTRRIATRVAMLTPEGSSTGDIFATVIEYVSIYFLHEVRTFHAVLADVAKHRDDLRTLFIAIGELDAWQSVAAYRAGLGDRGFVEPTFTDAGPRLKICDARHPLLADPVPNSIEIADASIAITGSNMSGKSSFLRTIGVNVLLAQTIDTCLATAYLARPLRILSSMDESDDLLEGKSYYLAEAQRLLTLVREAERGEHLLALVDEPLAGTNSPERLAASREILRHLAAHNGLVLVSTHDVELVTQLQQSGQYEPYYFSDHADDQGISFDYRLRRGLEYHGNAIKVLKYLGYPEAIVASALASMPAAARV
jgi:hypothetical protein